MRPEVWGPFQKKFNIPRVVEFYGSTEGNANLCNNSGVIGAIGLVPSILEVIYPLCLAACDPDTGELVRDPKTGLAVLAKTGEPGQLLGYINDKDPTRRFDGYTDKAATAKKIVQDVKRKGDNYFLTGDLLKKDWFGFYYWVDRIGDTYRWKGENVSTAEVAAAFTVDESSSGPGLRFVEGANVYGVLVPGQDGRAGMARLDLRPGAAGTDVEMDKLYAEVAAQLPSYARPVFLRVPKKADAAEEGEAMTGTFKHKKGPLRDQGFDPKLCGGGNGNGDKVFFRDDEKKTYVEVGAELYQQICAGKVRL